MCGMQRGASLRAVLCSTDDSPFEHREENDGELASVVKRSLRSHGEDARRQEGMAAATEGVDCRACGPPAAFSRGRNGGEIGTHPSQVPASPNDEDETAERSAAVSKLRETGPFTTAPRDFSWIGPTGGDSGLAERNGFARVGRG